MTNTLTNCGSRFVLKGELYREGDSLNLAVSLIDTKAGLQIWGDTSRAESGLKELYRFKNKVVHTLAAKVCGELGIILKTISRESKDKEPRLLSSYEAMLRFWEYEQLLTPERFRCAFEALTYAVKTEPDCCNTLGALAILYGNIHNLDIPGFENPLEKAVLPGQLPKMFWNIFNNYCVMCHVVPLIITCDLSYN